MLKFIRPEPKYIQSHREAFGVICKEKDYLSTAEAFPLESTVELMHMVIEKHIPQVLVIDTETDRCVGWCDALPREDAAIGYVGTGLLKAYRDAGIGTRILREVIALSRQYGYRKLELDVRASNQRAIRVYEKAGFKACNTIEDGYTSADGRTREDVIQMELTLNRLHGMTDEHSHI